LVFFVAMLSVVAVFCVRYALTQWWTVAKIQVAFLEVKWPVP